MEKLEEIKEGVAAEELQDFFGYQKGNNPSLLVSQMHKMQMGGLDVPVSYIIDEYLRFF
jgi:hypothetical protein